VIFISLSVVYAVNRMANVESPYGRTNHFSNILTAGKVALTYDRDLLNWSMST